MLSGLFVEKENFSFEWGVVGIKKPAEECGLGWGVVRDMGLERVACA